MLTVVQKTNCLQIRFFLLSKGRCERVNQYIKRETKIENYDPCPRFLSKMKVSPIAKLVYTTLLGRTFLSRKNGLKDENGKDIVLINDIKFKGKRSINWDDVNGKKYLYDVIKTKKETSNPLSY